MSSDTWTQLQAHKRKQESLKERLLKRRKERQGLLEGSLDGASNNPVSTSVTPNTAQPSTVVKTEKIDHVVSPPKHVEMDAKLERTVVLLLCNKGLNLPISMKYILSKLEKEDGLREASQPEVNSVLDKLEAQQLISLELKHGKYQVTCCEYSKLGSLFQEQGGEDSASSSLESRKRKKDSDARVDSPEPSNKRTSSQPEKIASNKDTAQSLLAMPTMKEKENKKVGEEILELLNEPTAKELSLMDKFRSQGGTSVKEFCLYGTRDECWMNNTEKEKCTKLHFKKILQKHTDESLGDCSFLNTCFHMDTCKYVHYEVDYSACLIGVKNAGKTSQYPVNESQIHVPLDKRRVILYPPQWVQCDLRSLDFNVLGKFSVVMADPPWDIHMELPYGTMQDNEMRNLPVWHLQDEGYIFLWVTGRAMELGRDCLDCWGYERCNEIIWVKTNQLQRLIRTGRTGHWINHGKEHCLVGVKGKPKGFNKGLDCDVLVSEVRDTSHKPDEIYGLIERLAPGTRKIELFGRQHNVQPNWITLGNQLRGVNLLDPEVVKRFKDKYPDGNCMKRPGET